MAIEIEDEISAEKAFSAMMTTMLRPEERIVDEINW